MPVGAIVARNRMDGVTVLASDVKGSHSVEWAALGDPSGDDIQFIPNEVLESVAFRRAVSRGIVEIMEDESDPDVVGALAAQVAAFKRRQEGAKEDVQVTIDRPTSRDSLSVFCVGPDSRGIGKCGQAVAVPEKQLKDVPPLCTQHKHLAAQFVPEVVNGAEDKVEWVHVTLGARERL
jgi:hypothetical protein